MKEYLLKELGDKCFKHYLYWTLPTNPPLLIFDDVSFCTKKLQLRKG